MKRRTIWKFTKRLIYAVLFFGVLSNVWIAMSYNSLILADIEKIPEKDFALVLGTSKESKSGINPYFKYRMEAAAELYHHKKVKQIIVSGDNSIKGYDETSDMENYLVGLGIPKKAIIKDYAGFRTLDSVVRAKKVFNANSLIIVSQAFHNKRAIYIAKHFNIDAVAFNAKDVKRRWGSFHYRELFARPLMFLDLYLFITQPKFIE